MNNNDELWDALDAVHFASAKRKVLGTLLPKLFGLGRGWQKASFQERTPHDGSLAGFHG